jgi:hypothetical protein
LVLKSPSCRIKVRRSDDSPHANASSGLVVVRPPATYSLTGEGIGKAMEAPFWRRISPCPPAPRGVHRPRICADDARATLSAWDVRHGAAMGVVSVHHRLHCPRANSGQWVHDRLTRVITGALPTQGNGANDLAADDAWLKNEAMEQWAMGQ